MMQPCPRCQTPNRADARFCTKCGASLSATQAAPSPQTPPGPSKAGMIACPNCGAESSSKAAFCNQCGQPLPPEPAPLQSRVTQALTQTNQPRATPPPYSPPRVSRQQPMPGAPPRRTVGLIGLGVLAIIALIVVFAMAVSLLAGQPVGVASPTPTATQPPRPPEPIDQPLEVIIVGEESVDLIVLSVRYCGETAFINIDDLLIYAHTVAELSDIRWRRGAPVPLLQPGTKLIMPACPPRR